jgi:hypothetical protein
VNRRQEKQRGALRKYRKQNQRNAIARWDKERARKQASEPLAPLPPPRNDPSAVSLAPVNGNPHHKATNLVNGADLRRHGSHAWCAFETSGERRDGLCIPQFLHAEFIGKGARSDADVRAWYGAVLDRYKGAAIGEDALTFWRNEFAGWVGTVTASPDTNSKAARNMAGARRTLDKLARGEPLVSPLAMVAKARPS